MQVQHHVNVLAPGAWPRCRSVMIRGEELHCDVDWQHLYHLEDAYSAQPHVAFLKIRTDEDLRAFTQKWGPLVLPSSPGSEVTLPVRQSWSRQRRLAAFIGLVRSVRDGENEREALEEFLTAESETWGITKGISLVILSRFFPALTDGRGAMPDVIREAELKTIRAAVAAEIREAPLPGSPGFDVRLRRPGEVVARWKIDTLQDALRWMVWRDEWAGRPLTYCTECNTPFCPKTKHRRKYCSFECAHKVAARNWARQKRKKTPSKGR